MPSCSRVLFRKRLPRDRIFSLVEAINRARARPATNLWRPFDATAAGHDIIYSTRTYAHDI